MATLKPLYLNDDNCLVLNAGRYRACVDLSSLIQDTALNLNSPITGYTVGANSILADTDTILQAFGKTQGQLNGKIPLTGTIDLSGSIVPNQLVNLGSVNNKFNNLYSVNTRANKGLFGSTAGAAYALNVSENNPGDVVGYIENQNTNGFGVAINSYANNNNYILNLNGNNGTSRMWVGSNGNIGIEGVTSPNAPLQFANTEKNRKIVLWELVNNDHQFLGFGISPSILRYQVAETGHDHVFYAGTSSTTSNELGRFKGNMSFEAQGSALIGNSINSAQITLRNKQAGVFTNDFIIGGQSASTYIGNYQNHALSFVTNNTSRMYLTGGGDVVIGSTTAYAKVSIVSSTSAILRLKRDTSDFGFEIGGGNIGFYNYTTAAYTYYVNGTTNNVTIGGTTDNGLAKLQTPSISLGTNAWSIKSDDGNERMYFGTNGPNYYKVPAAQQHTFRFGTRDTHVVYEDIFQQLSNNISDIAQQKEGTVGTSNRNWIHRKEASGTDYRFFDWTGSVATDWWKVSASSELFTLAQVLYAKYSSDIVIQAGGIPLGNLKSILTINSTTQGVLLPRMTTTQKNAITSPAEGLVVYDLTLHEFCFYNGSTWRTITSS